MSLLSVQIMMINLTSNSVTAVAGKFGVEGYVDGPALQAEFSFSTRGVAMDSTGRLLIMDK